MARPSSVDRLPEEVRATIGKLRGLGWTIDEIHEHLRGLIDQAPSRSALGRHIKGLAAMGERMRRSRQVAEALVRELGDAPESRAARLNIELMHSAILDLFMQAEVVGEDGQRGPAVVSDPEAAMLLAKAVDHLARASKTNVDFVAAAEKRATEKARAEAASSAEAVARQKGLSGETVQAIKTAIFGVAT